MSEGLILASASASRAILLRNAGVAFRAEPAAIDEEAVKRQFRLAGKNAAACAMALAEAKARVVSARHPGAIVLGADQLLVQGADWFDKPADCAAAADQLRRLAGKTHELVTAACAVRDDACLWRETTTPRMTMRRFGEAFLAGYIAAEGDALLGSVGAYRIEGRGAQLFERVDGDYFAVLGLPLLGLLGFLRGCGVLQE